MSLTILTGKAVAPLKFVEYWSVHYSDKHEQLYMDGIVRPLTEAKARDLFKWKVSERFFNYRLKDIEKNFIGRLNDLEKLSAEMAPREFLRLFSDGGPIWRIFWLHCWNPRYPIFDQHVYRAMKYVQTGQCTELPYDGETKIDLYLNEYLPFFEQFAAFPDRKGDKALLAFGEFLSQWQELLKFASH